MSMHLNKSTRNCRSDFILGPNASSPIRYNRVSCGFCGKNIEFGQTYVTWPHPTGDKAHRTCRNMFVSLTDNVEDCIRSYAEKNGVDFKKLHKTFISRFKEKAAEEGSELAGYIYEFDAEDITDTVIEVFQCTIFDLEKEQNKEPHRNSGKRFIEENKQADSGSGAGSGAGSGQ